MQQIIVTKEMEGQRLDKFLFKYFDHSPNSFIYKMLRKKNIKLNERKSTGNDIIRSGDLIQIYMTDETIMNFRNDHKIPDFSKIKPLHTHKTNITRDFLKHIEILYESNDVIVINKPVNMLSQKASKNDYSLNERIVDYYHTKYPTNTLFKPSVCNRLDRNTSGIVIAGLSLNGSQTISKMLKERSIDKYYLTIACGEISNANTVKGFLTKKKSHNQVEIYNTKEEALHHGIESPAYIETYYEPLFYGNLDSIQFTILKVKLITGKTHQIRAHLSSVHHPIVGDGKYGLKNVNDVFRKKFGLKHQLLHAYELTFPLDMDSRNSLNVLSGKVFRAKPPKQFIQIIEKILTKEDLKEFINGYMEF